MQTLLSVSAVHLCPGRQRLLACLRRIYGGAFGVKVREGVTPSLVALASPSWAYSNVFLQSANSYCNKTFVLVLM